MRWMPLMLLGACAPKSADLIGSWELSSQVSSEGVETSADEDGDVLVIGWFTSGFEFRSGGVLFGLVRRDEDVLAVNRGQKGRYRIVDDGVLEFSDDIFGPTPGRLEERADIVALDPASLELRLEDGTTLRFVR